MKDTRDSFYEHLDDITGLNAGWKAFVDEMISKNKVSNNRLFRLLKSIKGSAFTRDLRSLMRVVGKGQWMRISRVPAGICLKDKRWKTIPELWIDVKSDETGGMSGFMYIQVKSERFIKIYGSF
jgi:hypothetical protein